MTHHTARVFKFPERRSEIAKLRAEIEELRNSLRMVLAPTPSLAQDADDVGHGREIAHTICAACYIVANQLVSPNSEAPPIPVLAATPGVTTIALTAALLTSHRQMPNIILQLDERRDVIAYILSLK
jgi:mono/diheme cytochrome c family protein